MSSVSRANAFWHVWLITYCHRHYYITHQYRAGLSVWRRQVCADGTCINVKPQNMKTSSDSDVNFNSTMIKYHKNVSVLSLEDICSPVIPDLYCLWVNRLWLDGCCDSDQPVVNQWIVQTSACDGDDLLRSLVLYRVVRFNRFYNQK